MQKENFTATRVSGYECEPGRQQSIFWDAKTTGLGLRVTAAGARAYIFESRLFGKTVRVTIGDARAWELGKARTEAARLKTLVDDGKDPREIKAEQRAAHEARKEEARRQATTFGDAWGVDSGSQSPVERTNFQGPCAACRRGWQAEIARHRCNDARTARGAAPIETVRPDRRAHRGVA